MSTDNTIHYNDIIALLLEGNNNSNSNHNNNSNHVNGYVGISSSLEPLQEYNEYCTQLRIIPLNDINVNELPSNFYERCLFRIISANNIQNDKKQVLYGDDIRLCHEQTGCYLQSTIQSNVFDINDSSCIYLTNDNDKINDNSTIWIISSQYKFRSIEDQVYRNDYITLKSVINDRYINSINPSPDTYVYDHLLSLSDDDIDLNAVKGFQLKVISSYETTTKEMDSDCIRIGDYITIWHTELKGLVISRVDDEKDIQSKFSPLGRVCRTLSKPKHRTHGVYVRSCDKFSKLYDSVFQILPHETAQMFGTALHEGDLIVLRHLVSGLYLTFRPPNPGDTIVLFNESCTRLNDSDALICDETLCVAMTEEKRSSSFRIGSVDSKNLSKSLVYTQNIFCQHLNTSMTFAFSLHNDEPRWFEYENDFPLKPAFHSFARGNIWQFIKVEKQFLQELMFVNRMLPSCRAAIVCTQINSSLVANVPILRQFHLTLRTLLHFITGKIDSKSTLIESIVVEEERAILNESTEEKNDYIFVNTDGNPYFENGLDEICNDVETNTEYLPSISYWLGRDITNSFKGQYEFRDSESDFVKEEIIFYRQQLISDSRFLDHMIHFVNICFILSRSNEYDNDDYPIELISCCKLITKLLSFCCYKNAKVSRKIASMHGTLMSFICQHISGWLSPIDAILEELHETNNEKLLTDNNLIHIIEQMQQLKSQGRIEEAILVIQLLSTLFSSNAINNSNNTVAGSILPPYMNDTSREIEFESILFKIRQSSDGNWQINFDLNMQTFAEYSESDAVIFQEIRNFREFFKKYNTTIELPSSNHEAVDEILDFFECFNMLIDLGFAGQLLRDELNNLEGSSETQFLFWWLSRKSFLVTSSFSSLHNFEHNRILEVFHLLDNEEVGQVLSPFSQRTDKWSVQGLWEQEQFDSNANESEMNRSSPFFWDKLIQSRIPLFSSPSFLNYSKVKRQSVGLGCPSIGFTMLNGWIDLFGLFHASCPERQWLRKSLRLLGQLCGGNYANQLMVGRLLSAELLLDILVRDIYVVDKALIYFLLHEIYVSHDFVFATSYMLELDEEVGSNIWIGMNEKDMNSKTTCSEVFNLYSRLSCCFFREGLELRSQLVNCIRRDIYLLNLSSTLKDDVIFAIAFQKLLLELLRRGFLDKQEDTSKTVEDSISIANCFDASLCCSSMLDIEMRRLQNDFNSQTMLSILRDKLQWYNDMEILTDICAFDDIDAFMNFQMKCRKLYNDHCVIESKKLTILMLEHEFKEKQFGYLIDIANDVKGIIQCHKMSSSFQEDIANKILNSATIKKTVASIFSCASETRLNTLLHVSLHNHYSLQEGLYKLIYNDMNPCIYLQEMLPKIKFTSSFQSSFILRLADRFCLLIRSYVDKLLSGACNVQVVNAIKYLLECTQCLATIHHDDICHNDIENSDNYTTYNFTKTFFAFINHRTKQTDDSQIISFEIEVELDSDIDTFDMSANYNHNNLSVRCYEDLFSIAQSLIFPIQSWDHYSSTFQDLIDQLCLCIASVIRGSFELCMTCFDILYPFVILNWENSDGVARLVQILFETCTITEDSNLKEFKIDILEKCLAPGRFEDIVYIFRSIINNEYNPELRRYFTIAFVNREMYTLIPISTIGDEILPAQLCLIQILIGVLKTGYCNDACLTKIRLFFTEDFLQSCLNNLKSLIFRGYVLELSCLLHDYSLLASSLMSDMKAIETLCTSRLYFIRHQYHLKEFLNSVVTLIHFSLKVYMQDSTLLHKANKLIKQHVQDQMNDDIFFFELLDIEIPQLWSDLPYIYCQCLVSFIGLLLANNSIILSSYNDIDLNATVLKFLSLTIIILESTFDDNLELKRQLKKKLKIIVENTIQIYKATTISFRLEQMCQNDIKNIITRLILTEHERRLVKIKWRYTLIKLFHYSTKLILILISCKNKIDCIEVLSNDISNNNIRDHSILKILNNYLSSCRDFVCTADNPSNITEITFKKELTVDFLLKLKKNDHSTIWILFGSMIIKNLIQYLSNSLSSESYEQHHIVLLRTLLLMLDNNIDEINGSVHDGKKRTLLLFYEIQELKQIQLAMIALGSVELIYETICASNTPTLSTSLALALCTKLVRGNDKVKTVLMQTIQNLDNKNSHFRKGFCTVIHQMLKHCGLQLSRIDWSQPPSSSSIHTLKSFSQIMKFIGVFCEGQNANVQSFIREQPCKISVDLVSKVGTVIETLLIVIESNISYLSNPIFTTELAPLIPMDPKLRRRKMIAWHADELNYSMIIRLLETAKTCFLAVKELCQVCHENQILIIKRISRWPMLLEYLGAMQLNETTTIRNGYYNSRVTWKGYNAIDFVSNYKKELARLNSLHHDDISQIDNFIENKHEHQLISAVAEIGQETELALLKMILSLIETGSISKINDVFSNCNEPIMLQNMNTYYKLSFQRNAKRLSRSSFDRSSELAVLYYSTLSAIAAAKLINGQQTTVTMIAEWEKSHALTSFVASVEIVDSCDRICTIFFDIPSLVSKYWSYPETRRIRSDIKWTVTRTSPEEKLYSFYECMNEVIHVMKRQRRLSKALTPVIHSIFGGKSFINCTNIIPKQRLCFLILTILLNMYYAYLSFNSPNDQSSSLIHSWSSYVVLLSGLHSCIGGLLLIRHILNSRAADHLIHTGKQVSLISQIITVPKVIAYVGSDTWWPCVMIGCSILALIRSYYALYAICLLDAIPQLRFMNFLIIAIKKNLVKVIFTILLAIILLYLISVTTYLFFADQYSFQGHYGCDSFLNCFKLHVDYGLQNQPSWNDDSTIQPTINGINENTFLGRLSSNILGSAYNLIYVILFNLVLQSILSGLIIDAFTRMREENDLIEHDIRSQCFICSIQREEFGHNGMSYDHHIKQEHNMWKYVWFSIYIDEKDPNTMSGTEHYAYQMMQDKQSFVKLIPIKRSLSIERKQ